MHRQGNRLLAIAVICGALWGHFPATGTVDGDAASPGPVLAWVDGEAVTTGDLEAVLSGVGRPPAGAASHPEFSPEAVLRRLIQNRLLEQEGYRIGADRRPEVRNQVQDLIQFRSMEALLDSVQAEVPEPEPAEMDSLLDRTHTMRRLSHILVGTRDLAAALLDSLEAGVPFAGLACRHSLDTTWAKAGGDLGWAGEGRFIPEFEALLPGMAAGDVAGPVRTEDGWHLVLLAETHTETAGQSASMKNALRDARMRERVMKTMQAFLSSLMEKHGVTVNEALLATLDYASADPALQAELQTSNAALAHLPGRNLTVRGLTFKIRFKYFHGTEGKENADRIRDTIFNDWLTESLFRYEAMVRGFREEPAVVAAADRLERRLLREIVLESVAGFDVKPDPKEIAAYYDAHRDAFMRPLRVKAEGVLLSDEPAARAFREKLEQGAALGWLAERSPGVVNARPPLFSDWLEAETLDLSGGVNKGTIAGPVLVGGEWAVARVKQVAPPRPVPLADCRPLVVKKLRSEKRHAAVSRSLALLESHTRIEVEDTAHGVIEKRIEEWLGGRLPKEL